MEAAASKKEAGSADAQDPSMEEILQSIRKIIAEDDGSAKDNVNKETPKPEGPKLTAAPETPVSGSEVLELTDMVKDDGSVVNLKDATPAPAGDVLSQIDSAIGSAPAVPPPPPSPAPTGDTLLSQQTANTAAAALKKIHTISPEQPLQLTPSPAFRSGSSVEDMVIDMLRPMMKEWLDANLPAIVERMVEREVKRLARP